MHPPLDCVQRRKVTGASIGPFSTEVEVELANVYENNGWMDHVPDNNTKYTISQT